jgi:hypothetical protein
VGWLFFIIMNEWTIEDEKRLIYLAEKNLSVGDIRLYFPNLTVGSIAGKLNKLRKQKKLPPGYKIRMTSWDEPTLIELAKKGLTAAEIAEQIPGTTPGMIVGRLSTLRTEKKLPADFVVITGNIKKSSVKNKPKKSLTVKKDKTGPVNKKVAVKEGISDKNTAVPAPSTVINYAKLYFEVNERISKLETDISTKKGLESREIMRGDAESPENSRYSSEIIELQKKIEHLTNHELSALLNKISNLERKISALEIILSDYKHQNNLHKDIWASVRQSAELNGSSELLKILQDAENISAKRR